MDGVAIKMALASAVIALVVLAMIVTGVWS